MKKLKEHIHIIIIAIGSFFTHFIFFGYPAQTVFDEVHFGKFISGYFNGEYFFDIHPPLAKLLITAFGFLGGYQPEIDFGVIGEQFTTTGFIWLRLLPTLAGALLPIVIYYLCRSLNFSKLTAFFAGALVIFENSLLVQSRFILLDSLLLLFGFGSLFFYFLYQKQIVKKTSRYFLLIAVVCASFAFSIKWTGGSFLLVILIFEFIGLFKKRLKFSELFVKAGLFFVIPFLIYFSTFAIHFALLYKSGPGKNFMTKNFQKTLIDNQYQNDESVTSLGIMGKFVELNREMYRSNQRLSATHPYSSKWYTWPIMKRPIYYWVQKQESASQESVQETVVQNDKVGKIYLLGNPFIYWFGSASVIFFVLYFIFEIFGRREEWRKKRNIYLLLFAGFFLNLLPFIFIGRVMFLYHYFSSLIFSILILAFLINEIQSKRIQKIAVIALFFISMATFLYFSPLTYGLPLQRSGQEARFLFSTWE